MSNEDDCQPQTLVDFWQHLWWLAMRDTAAFFGIKWGLVAIGGIVVAIGGTWHTYPKVADDIAANPSPLAIAILVMFSILLVVGAHAQHVEDHAKFGGIIAGLRGEMISLQSQARKDTPANLVFVRRIINDLVFQAERHFCSGGDTTEWKTNACEFVRLALVPKFAHGGSFGNDQQFCIWLEHVGNNLEEEDIAHDCTESRLAKWIPVAKPDQHT